MLHMAEPFLEQHLHPTVICRGYIRALEDALKLTDALAFPLDVNDRGQLLNVVQSCIATKFTSRRGAEHCSRSTRLWGASGLRRLTFHVGVVMACSAAAVATAQGAWYL